MFTMFGLEVCCYSFFTLIFFSATIILIISLDLDLYPFITSFVVSCNRIKI